MTTPNPFAPSSQSFSWVEQDLQEPMLPDSENAKTYEPRDVSMLCEGCFDMLVQCGDCMLIFPLSYLGGLLFTATAVFYSILFWDVLDVSTKTGKIDQAEATYITLQVLSGMLTYASLSYLPTLLRDWVRLFKARFAGVENGQEWTGAVTPSADAFDYVPWCHRLLILSLYVLGCYVALVNQVSQLLYLDYYKNDETNTKKAKVHTHVYLVGALSIMFSAKVYQLVMQHILKKQGKAPNCKNNTKEEVQTTQLAGLDAI